MQCMKDFSLCNFNQLNSLKHVSEGSHSYQEAVSWIDYPLVNGMGGRGHGNCVQPGDEFRTLGITNKQ